MGLPFRTFRILSLAAICAGQVYEGTQSQADPASALSAFSKPSTEDLPNGTPGVTLPDNADGFHRWGGISSAQSGSLPEATPDLSTRQSQQQKDRAEWSLLTPEEIMGIQTPEEMFGLAVPGQDLSPEERYMNRQEAAKKHSATTSSTENQTDASRDFSNGQSLSQRGFSSLFDQPGTDSSSLDGSHSQIGPGFSRIFGGPQNGGSPQRGAARMDAAQSAASGDRAVEAQREELDMANFRKLIGETPPAPQTAFAKSDQNNLSGLETPFAFSGQNTMKLVQPKDPSKPEGLALPPEIVGYAAPPRKVKRPSWQPQLPPWMNDDSTPSSRPPQRKFY